MSIRRAVTALSAAALAVGLVVATTGPASAAVAGQTTFTTSLSGAEAVPTGDPDGFGQADIIVGPGDRLCYRIIAGNIGPITGVHLHQAPAGQIGGHAVDFHGTVTRLSDGRQIMRGCETTSLTATIVANPTNYYVNVHTAQFPDGALRGQLGD